MCGKGARPRGQWTHRLHAPRRGGLQRLRGHAKGSGSRLQRLANGQSRQLEGRARLGDLDGDGVPELIIKGESGMIMHTLATEASADSSW